MIGRVLLGLLALALAGCTTPGVPAAVPTPAMESPQLSSRLTPAKLGRDLALNQHLWIEASGNMHELDALLEVDQHELRLALLVLGNPVARLRWNGQHLDEQRSAGWPRVVTAERILDDLLLVYWPVEAIVAALPAGWDLRLDQDKRELRWQDRLIVTVDAHDLSMIKVDNWAQNYHLRIAAITLER